MSDDEMMWDDAGEDDGDDGGEEEEVEEDEDDAPKKDGKGGKNQSYKWENIYFKAKDQLEDEPDAAIKKFEDIVKGESPQGEWSYKSLKRLVRLYQNKNNAAKVLEYYQQLLALSKAVTENVLFKGINKCLDIVASSNLDLINKAYDATLSSLKNSKSDTFWFKIKHKQAKLLLDKNEPVHLAKALDELHKSCLGKDGKLDPKKGSNLIDVYSLEIQLAMNNKDRKKTKEIYQRALQVAKENPCILNSRLAIFHFCGGKILMEQHEWEQAYSSFQEAFRFFEEAGNSLKIPCLKYLVLANMLRLSKIDPFNSPDTANLKNHKEIAPMASLAVAYANNDIKQFEKILSDHKKNILGDPFIAFFLTDLLREMRTQVLLEVIRPYTRIKMPFLAKELNISLAEVESLLVDLILDSKIVGHIDQVQQLVTFEATASSAVRKYNALEKWTNSINSTHALIINRLN